MLSIKNLRASVEGKEFLKGFGGIFAYSALQSVVGGSVINNYSKFSFCLLIKYSIAWNL